VSRKYCLLAFPSCISVLLHLRGADGFGSFFLFAKEIVMYTCELNSPSLYLGSSAFCVVLTDMEVSFFLQKILSCIPMNSIQLVFNVIALSLLHNHDSVVSVPYNLHSQTPMLCNPSSLVHNQIRQKMLGFSSHYTGDTQCHVEDGKMLICTVHEPLIDFGEYHDNLILVGIVD